MVTITESEFRSEAGQQLNIDPEQIDIKNWSNFADGKDRYLFGSTQEGFLKTALTDEWKLALQRELVGQSIARSLGIQTCGVIKGYQETSSGLGFILLKKIPDVTHARLQLGSIASNLIPALSGQEIPQELKDPILLGDWRNISPEKFWVVWNDHNNTVSSDKYSYIREKLIDKQILSESVELAETDFKSLTSDEIDKEIEYFVHNDMTPDNIYLPFSFDWKQAIQLDFEYSGKSHYRALTLVTDISQFYGRLWSDPGEQQDFLIGLLRNPAVSNDLQERYRLIRSAAVFGAIYLSKYAMDLDHPEHPMTESLLKNLAPNLRLLNNQHGLLIAQSQHFYPAFTASSL